MNLVDLSSATMKDALTVLVQNKTLLAPSVSATFILALLSVLGFPVVCACDQVAGTTLCNVTLA
jgi:hypothetical protein